MQKPQTSGHGPTLVFLNGMHVRYNINKTEHAVQSYAAGKIIRLQCWINNANAKQYLCWKMLALKNANAKQC